MSSSEYAVGYFYRGVPDCEESAFGDGRVAHQLVQSFRECTGWQSRVILSFEENIRGGPQQFGVQAKVDQRSL